MKLKFARNPTTHNTTNTTPIPPLKPAVKAQPAMCAHGLLPGYCVVSGCINATPRAGGKLCGHSYTLGSCPSFGCPHYGVGSPYGINVYPNYKSWVRAPSATRLLDPAEKTLLVQVLNDAIEVQGVRHMAVDPQSEEAELVMMDLERLVNLRLFVRDEL